MSITLKDIGVKTSRTSTDELVVTNLSGTSWRISLTNFMANWPADENSFDIDGLSEISSLEDNDFFVVLDDTDGQHKKITKDNVESAIGGGGGTEFPYVLLQDQKTQNTDGGSFVNGARRTRDLNVEVIDDDNICVLTSNQFSLETGTYRIYATVPAFYVYSHQAYLFNDSETTTVLKGTSERSVNTSSCSIIVGEFTVSDDTDLYEIQHECMTSRSNDGFGFAANFDTEIYTTVQLWKSG